MIKVNPLLRKLASHFKEPERLDDHGRYYDFLAERQARSEAHTDEERLILALVREPDLSRVDVAVGGGRIKNIATERQVPIKGIRDLERLLDEKKFQTVSIIKTDGAVSSVTQRDPKVKRTAVWDKPGRRPLERKPT